MQTTIKFTTAVMIKGVLTPEQINVILSCCDAGEYFIPNQVGLPERKFEKIDPQVDHCWFELTRDDFEYTDQPANVPVTAQQLTDHFIAAKDSWNDCEFFEQSDQNITGSSYQDVGYRPYLSTYDRLSTASVVLFPLPS